MNKTKACLKVKEKMSKKVLKNLVMTPMKKAVMKASPRKSNRKANVMNFKLDCRLGVSLVTLIFCKVVFKRTWNMQFF